MPTNQYLPFATAVGANALSFPSWEAQTTVRGNGFQPGIALSEQVNTVLRQATVAAAGVATFSTTFGPNDTLDDGNPANFAVALKAAIDSLIANAQGWRSGDIKTTLDPGVQPGWVEPIGQIVSRTGEFAGIFARLGITYGAGNGTTTFQLPDFRGLFMRTLDAGRNIDPDSARALGSVQADMVKAHKHNSGWGEFNLGPFGQSNTSNHLGTNSNDADNYQWWTNDGSNQNGTVNAPGAIGPETRPRNIAVRVLMRL